ncbi:MAG: hypothetical protein NVSMB56_05980 [Pyrinomonadaceae bacterium]
MENFSVEKQANRMLMTFVICPCCGADKVAATASEECHACGARAVGAPLAPPENLVPSYWRAFGAFAFGTALISVFLVLTLTAWFADKALSFGVWDFVTAGETAAWRLKWFALPASVFVVYVGRRTVRLVKSDPTRFTGMRLARFGVNASASFALAVAVLIVITVPARLQQRELARRAERDAIGYSFLHHSLAYKAHFGTFPSEVSNLGDLKKFKEFAADDSLDALIIRLKDAKYEPTTDIATTLPLNDAKSRGGSRGAITPARLRQVSLTAGAELNAGRVDDVQSETLPFTNFKITLAGEEGFFSKEDDLELTEDGFVSPSVLKTANTRTAKPSASKTTTPRRIQ